MPIAQFHALSEGAFFSDEKSAESVLLEKVSFSFSDYNIRNKTSRDIFHNILYNCYFHNSQIL